jgi:hypothetical protein
VASNDAAEEQLNWQHDRKVNTNKVKVSIFGS